MRHAVVLAAVMLLAPASAHAAGTRAIFEVTVQGQIQESWNYKEDAARYICSPYYEGSGTATLRFASPHESRIRVEDRKGFIGDARVHVDVERQGSFITTNREPPCAGPPQAKNHSGCGTRSYETRVKFLQGNRFGLSLPGDRSSWAAACPYPEDPTPLEGASRFQTTEALAKYGPRWSYRRHLYRRKKTTTLTFTKHVEQPYTQSKLGDPASGSYVADLTWTVEFRRIGRIRR